MAAKATPLAPHAPRPAAAACSLSSGHRARPRGADRGGLVVRAAATGAATGAAGGDVPSRVDIPPDGKILLVGVTGVTGRTALQGLLTVAGPGRSAHSLVAMTRNPGGAGARSLPPGIQVITGDLDEAASLESVLRGVSAVYCHALSKDGSTADPMELVRARKLAEAAKAAGVGLIIYNSSGGRGSGYGITQMEQKHRVEDELAAAAVPTVALRASMFMEEFWKRYTRPGILKGKLTWSMPADRPLQLVAARDLGLAAGHVLVSGGGPGAAPFSRTLRAIELSGDELSPAEMCEVFSRVQGGPVRHDRAPAWPFLFLARDVFLYSRFFTERGYDGDVAACRKQFPGMLSFEEFLRATGWADPSKTYEDGIAFASGATAPPPAPSPTAQQ